MDRREMPVLRLSILYAALFFDLGINLPFFPIWLGSHALDAGEIGIVLAAPLVARLIANPVVTDFADRRGAVSQALAVSAVLVLLGTIALTATAHFLPILVLVFLIGLAQGPLIALTDAYTWSKLRSLVEPQRREHAYGLIRLWGSLGFIVASVGAGRALDWFAPSLIIWLLAAAAAVLAVTARAVARSERGKPRPAPQAGTGGGSIWLLAAIVVGAALVQASHGMYYAFSSLHWASEGRSGTEIGILWSIGVVAEIAFFAIGGRFFWSLGGPIAVVMIGGAGAVLRWIAMALDPSLGGLVVLQALHAITFGATHLGSVAAISRLAPSHLQARAQGWLAALWAGCMALLTTLSGFLYPRFGEGTYLVMALVALVGLALFAVAAMERSKPLSPAGEG